jgi:hypothetical protein
VIRGSYTSVAEDKRLLECGTVSWVSGSCQCGAISQKTGISSIMLIVTAAAQEACKLQVSKTFQSYSD